MEGAVPVQNGLKKFFIYFVIGAALGLFVNSLTQKYLTNLWLEWEPQLKEKNITGTRPSIVFSWYGWPVVGAHLASATHRRTVKCYEITAKVEDVFVPLPLFGVFSEKLRLGTVDVARMKVDIKENPACLAEQNAGRPGENDEVISAIQPSSPVSVLGATVAHPEWFSVLEKWFTTHEKTIKAFPVPRVRISEITIDGSTLSGKSLTAQGSADFNIDDELDLRLNFRPLEFKKRDRALSTNFTASLVADSEQITFSGDWAYDEGHLLLGLNYLKETGVADVSLETKVLPLSFINRWYDTSWAFQFLWFDCKLQLATNKETWNQSDWDISNCRISGNNGEVKVLSKTVHSLQSPGDVVFQIYNFDLDKVLKGKNNVPLTGIFKSFGVIEGQGHFSSKGFASKLLVKNAQVVFSRRTRRKLQVIDEISIQAGYERGIYSVTVPAAKIHGGEFKGFLAFDYNKYLKRSVGKISVDAVSFSDEIQELMWDGKFTPFAASGDLDLDAKFRIQSAKFNVGFKGYEAKGLSAQAGTVVFDWQEEGGKLNASLGQLKVSRNSEYPVLFAALLKESLNRDFMTFSKVYALGHFAKSHLIVEKLVASVANQRLEVSGDFTKKEAEGQWDWGSAPQDLSWKWQYRDRQFVLIPLKNEMREWLTLNDHYVTEYPFIRLESANP